MQASDFVDITPWTTATHTFTTGVLDAGLYSVLVEVQHKDDVNLAKNSTTGDTTSYAIGAHCGIAAHVPAVACLLV